MILENTIKNASVILKNNNISSHQLDAEIILSNIMGVSREFLLTKNDLYLNDEIIKKFNYAIQRRIKNEPVAYIVGQREFWDENFIVNYTTLVPRPETELLIYKTVNFFKNKSIRILDIGTGSGCILLSLLKELKLSKGTGIDISPKAIKTAVINSKKMNLINRSIFKVSDIKDFFSKKYDLIVSNPPYIPYSNLKNLSNDIRDYEPLIALNGGIDGLDLIKKVIYKSNTLLKRGGLLAIEIGNHQYIKVSSILKQNGYREIGKEFDYNHNVRCIISTKM
tara:strand:+ start:185 stop:1024 length:840 start_codon:yes stop_codon:yes gene_type:complete